MGVLGSLIVAVDTLLAWVMLRYCCVVCVSRTVVQSASWWTKVFSTVFRFDANDDAYVHYWRQNLA